MSVQNVEKLRQNKLYKLALHHLKIRPSSVHTNKLAYRKMINERWSKAHQCKVEPHCAVKIRKQHPHFQAAIFSHLYAWDGFEHRSTNDLLDPFALLEAVKMTLLESSFQIVERFKTLFSKTLLFLAIHTGHNIDQQTTCQRDCYTKLCCYGQPSPDCYC